ncbi:retinol-binding protein 2-like [Sphaerodactylus townsendi]|uniref:retinol-binding protein 2-like n=1 Tax=Sphaerodactylus townsendi TaxID=933632 RepID=UPI002025FABF|nr:retinol-binding protein 2-like [Sphaerodactylus townsendi]
MGMFINVEMGDSGRNNDAFVFQESHFCQAMDMGIYLTNNPMLTIDSVTIHPVVLAVASHAIPYPHRFAAEQVQLAPVLRKECGGVHLQPREGEVEMPPDLLVDIDFATRKIANHLKQMKEIIQEGDNFRTKTLSTFRNYEVNYTIGEEFEEHTKGLDNRVVKTLVSWDGDKLVCTQKGEKKNRGWKHWIEGDKLHLELMCEDQVCHQVFKKKK